MDNSFRDLDPACLSISIVENDIAFVVLYEEDRYTPVIVRCQNNTELLRSLASDSMLWSISGVIRTSMHDELLTHLTADKAAGHDLSAEPKLLTELIIGGLEQAARWWFTDTEPLPPEILKKQMLCSILRLIS